MILLLVTVKQNVQQKIVYKLLIEEFFVDKTTKIFTHFF